MSTKQTSSELTSRQLWRIPRPAWRYTSQRKKEHCRQWCLNPHWWDHPVWIKKRERRFESQAKSWIFRPPMASGLGHASKGLRQETLRLSIGALGEGFSASAIVGKAMQRTWLVLMRGLQKKPPDYQKVRTWSNAGNLKREQEMEDTLLDLLQPFTEWLEVWDTSSSTQTAWVTLSMKLWKRNLLMKNFLRLFVTDAVRDTLAKDTKSKKGTNQEETTMCSLICQKDPSCEVKSVRGQTTSRARCRIKPKKRVDGIAISTTLRDLITAYHKILNGGEWVERWTQKCSESCKMIFTTMIYNGIVTHELFIAEKPTGSRKGLFDEWPKEQLSQQCTADSQKNGGTAQWHAIVACATCMTKWPAARLRVTDHQYSLDHWLSTSRRQRQVKSTSFLERKRWKEYFLGFVLRAGGGWSGDLMIADCED